MRAAATSKRQRTFWPISATAETRPFSYPPTRTTTIRSALLHLLPTYASLRPTNLDHHYARELTNPLFYFLPTSAFEGPTKLDHLLCPRKPALFFVPNLSMLVYDLPSWTTIIMPGKTEYLYAHWRTGFRPVLAGYWVLTWLSTWVLIIYKLVLDCLITS